MLQEGDVVYLVSLSRPALLRVLLDELRFLGLYAREEAATEQWLSTFVERRLDAWVTLWLLPRMQTVQNTRGDMVQSVPVPWVTLVTI
jgi:hypothetical protein